MTWLKRTLWGAARLRRTFGRFFSVAAAVGAFVAAIPSVWSFYVENFRQNVSAEFSLYRATVHDDVDPMMLKLSYGLNFMNQGDVDFSVVALAIDRFPLEGRFDGNCRDISYSEQRMSYEMALKPPVQVKAGSAESRYFTQHIHADNNWPFLSDTPIVNSRRTMICVRAEIVTAGGARKQGVYTVGELKLASKMPKLDLQARVDVREPMSADPDKDFRTPPKD